MMYTLSPIAQAFPEVQTILESRLRAVRFFSCTTDLVVTLDPKEYRLEVHTSGRARNESDERWCQTHFSLSRPTLWLETYLQGAENQRSASRMLRHYLRTFRIDDPNRVERAIQPLVPVLLAFHDYWSERLTEGLGI